MSSASAGARFRAAVAAERPLQVVGRIYAYAARMASRVGFRADYPARPPGPRVGREPGQEGPSCFRRSRLYGIEPVLTVKEWIGLYEPAILPW